MAVTLTATAARHIEKMLAQRGKGAGLRVGVKTVGCAGFAYALDYADEIGDNDLVFENHGVRIIVDKEVLSYIYGTELDFTRDGLNERFTFRNPNVKDECGCGGSFSV